MRKIIFILSVITLLLSIVSFAGDKEDKEAIAQKYLTAYFKMDMDTVRQCLPAQNGDLFIKYPINGDITYQPAKVAKKQAVLEFTAKTNNNNIPSKGGIIFYKDNGVWKVRQIAFYNSIPQILGLPSKSKKEDAKYETEVTQKGKDFMAVWQKNDLVAMKGKWYDWTNRKDKQLPTSTKNWIFSHSTLADGTPLVKYTVDASYIVYKKKITGAVAMIKDNGNWKVKANHFFFYN